MSLNFQKRQAKKKKKQNWMLSIPFSGINPNSACKQIFQIGLLIIGYIAWFLVSQKLRVNTSVHMYLKREKKKKITFLKFPK